MDDERAGPGEQEGVPLQENNRGRRHRLWGTAILGALFPEGAVEQQFGGDVVSTAVMTPKVHAERVVTLVNQSLQLFIVANDENYALAA